MNIRKYLPEHYDACVEIFNSNTPQYFDPTEIDGLEQWLKGQNENRLAYGNTAHEHFYVLEDNDTIVGCGGFYIKRDEAIANMVWGMVNNVMHKNGYGKDLFLYRMKQIQSLYPECKIVLDTTQYTYGFFEKLGFTTTQVRKDFYGPGLDRYDMEQ